MNTDAMQNLDSTKLSRPVSPRFMQHEITDKFREIMMSTSVDSQMMYDQTQESRPNTASLYKSSTPVMSQDKI